MHALRSVPEILGDLLASRERKIAVAAMAIAVLSLLVSLSAVAQVGRLSVPELPGAVARLARSDIAYEAPNVQVTRFQYWFGKGYLNVSEIRMNLTDTRQSGGPATYNVMVSVVKSNGEVVNSFATRTLSPGQNTELPVTIRGGVYLDDISRVTIVVQRTS